MKSDPKAGQNSGGKPPSASREFRLALRLVPSVWWRWKCCYKPAFSFKESDWTVSAQFNWLRKHLFCLCSRASPWQLVGRWKCIRRPWSHVSLGVVKKLGQLLGPIQLVVEACKTTNSFSATTTTTTTTTTRTGGNCDVFHQVWTQSTNPLTKSRTSDLENLFSNTQLPITLWIYL